MSDNPKSVNNTSTLSATEEAFDEFQQTAVAYEENEFIMLSDIMPEKNPPDSSDIPSSYDDGLFNGQELHSLDTQQPSASEINVCLTPSKQTESDYSVDVKLNQTAPINHNETEHMPHLEETLETETVVRSTRRRGRKSNQMNVTKFVETFQTTPLSNLPSKPKGKRGRKPKQTETLNQSQSLDLDIAEPPKKVTRKRNSKRVGQSNGEPVDVQEDVTGAPKVIGRRGKRKPILEPLEVDSNIPSVGLEVDVHTEIPNAEKLSDNDADGDDLSLSQLKKTLSCDESNITTTPNVDTVTDIDAHAVLNSENKPKKRGRKPKINKDFEYYANDFNAENYTPDKSIPSKATSDKSVNETNNVSESIPNNLELPPEPEKKLEKQIDKIEITETTIQNNDKTNENDENNEDTSKRPLRRKARRTMHYEVDSDEDPFANYSDDEYVPGKITPKHVSSDSADDDIDFDESEDYGSKQKRKSTGINKSPKKKGKLKLYAEVNTIKPVDSSLEDFDNDIEKCLESSVIKIDKKGSAEKSLTNSSKKSLFKDGGSEFENFLAQKIGGQLQIKKVNNKEASESSVAPLEIPCIDPMEAKKTYEKSAQTSTVQTKSMFVQTNSPYALKMKQNLSLSSVQSEKACKFLNDILTSTTELGNLMTDKSQEFISKKVNTCHVKDTMKMDYCVKKAFLLFKLAKDNLTTMEENLEQQYEEFLKQNGLTAAIDKEKVIQPKPKINADSDSDCEIVEVIKHNNKPVKEKFNPKTVFLNKELSIKMAKKTPEPKQPTPDTKKINIKGRHAVWINDSVMVKKVKGSQSFLAQDSRNKKPPDSVYVTEEMVRNFFNDYYRQQANSICKSYTSSEWLSSTSNALQMTCNYFFITKDDEPGSSCSIDNQLFNTRTGENESDDINGNCDFVGADQDTLKKQYYLESPKKLFSLCTEVLQKSFQRNVESLSQLCVKAIFTSFAFNHQSQRSSGDLETYTDSVSGDSEIVLQDKLDVLPLKTLSFDKIQNMLNIEKYSSDILIDTYYSNANIDSNSDISNHSISSMLSNDQFAMSSKNVKNLVPYLPLKLLETSNSKNMKSLQEIAYQNLIELIYNFETHIDHEVAYWQINEIHSVKVKALADLSLAAVSQLLNSEKTNNHFQEKNADLLTIDTVNTMSEEAFSKINTGTSQISEYDEEDEEYCNDTDVFEACNLNTEIEAEETLNEASDTCNFNDENSSAMNENNWVSLLQMQDMKSCFIASKLNFNSINPEVKNNPLEDDVITRVKVEPVDEQAFSEVMVRVKKEPDDIINEMVHIPDNVVTKRELQEYSGNANSESNPPNTSRHTGYDVESCEKFVGKNKKMMALGENLDESIFTQSALRIRRQYEPDSDNEIDNNDHDELNLLIPHGSEPIPVDSVKGILMESSCSDDESKSTNKQKTSEKKLEAKKRGRKKKNLGELKQPITKQPPVVAKAIKEKEIPVATNEIAILTRRMREKIRNEEKKQVSSDSEHEPESVFKTKKDKNNQKEVIDKLKSNTKKMRGAKSIDNEIQCNNVDSTEQIADSNKKNKETEGFTGFSAVDQNEMSNYQKYVNFVYDQVLTKQTETENIEKNVSHRTVEDAAIDDQDRAPSPLIMNDEPVELLECAPSMPIFEQKSRRKPGPKSKVKNIPDNNLDAQDESINQNAEVKLSYVERHGWHCYSLDTNDKKLYKIAYVILEKLPEAFIETYLQYQEINEIRQEDEDVDRLTNLQSLHRQQSNKESGVQQKRLKDKGQRSDQTTDTGTGPASPAGSGHCSDDYRELTPSDDDCGRLTEDIPPPAPKETSENCLAKNLLMNENPSDNESASEDVNSKQVKVKSEPVEPDIAVVPSTIKPKPSSQKKNDAMKDESVKVHDNPKGLVLTADKMMKKEIALLHAPVILEQDIKYTPPKEGAPKPKEKHTLKSRTKRERHISGDDSSSEEEKQWVSTKEKLLKKMEKKVQEATSVDDAKRAKLVSEFIVRREDFVPASRAKRTGPRRSKKKMLEKRKQLKALTDELCAKKSFANYSKGRRNIRKVLDKKSLARSTVLANMEEFERKRRLAMNQNRLRELLGYEEGVNVLVINDEVCLEYDFEELQPVVTIHPFFTKVMKAHQYEGVKFMWDACFESLSLVSSGHGGGGCILAHCMGLGKTLQVLALLHTVLTHPRVGMQRVLVCCPLSTVLNWVDEIHKWLGPVTNQIKVFELSKLKKTYERARQLEDWYKGGGIFIIGYELFRSLSTLDAKVDNIRPTIVEKIRTALLEPGPDIIVCDEGHLLKNDSSLLAVAMSRVQTKRRIVLTGTPMQNNLREYYCMVDFVKPNLLGTYGEYSNRFENPIMNGQHRDSREEDIRLMKTRTHILHKVLEGCLQRQEASVLYPYLPKKHEYTVFISLTGCQSNMYKHYLETYAKQSKQSVLKDFHILQKIWSHPKVLHHFQMRLGNERENKVKEEKLEDDLAREDLTAREDVKPVPTETWWLQHLDGGNMLDMLEISNKFVTVFKILDECVNLGDKLLIFSTSLFTMDALEYFLKKINKWSLGQEYYRLDGSVPPEVRQQWCREFNAEHNLKTKLFLISTRAGCLGLNMTAANRVIILDTSWNPAHDVQSIFRVYRFGQKKDCFIYRLVAMGTMEQKIYERSVAKQAVACRVVDEQQIDRHYNMAELSELYRFDEVGSGVAGGVAVGVRDVVLLRVARDTPALFAVHEHDSLLRDTREELPEHERALAWHQFQQEQADKHEQNQLQSQAKAIKIPKLYVDKKNCRPTYGMLVQKTGLKSYPIKNENGPSTSYPTPQGRRPSTRTYTAQSESEDVKPLRPSSPSQTIIPDQLYSQTSKKSKKRGRKSKILVDIPVQKPQSETPSMHQEPDQPIQPVPSSTVVPETSADDPKTRDILKKITEALSKHNFSSNQLEAAEVAKVVSSIMADVTVATMPINIELTNIGKQMGLSTTEGDANKLNEPESAPLTTKKSKRGRLRKKAKMNDSVIPETKQVEEEPVPADGRRKRRAAVAANKQFDTSSKDSSVIDLSEEEDIRNADDDYVPDDDNEVTPNVEEPPPAPSPEIKKNKPKPKTKPIKEEAQNNEEPEDDSILLSDDESDEDVKPIITKQVAKSNEIYPVHVSLLTNKNFIQIVAHTYQQGNPMLDKDAALLAAEYSINKALKELESTGKQVDSGPIYDIAVQAIGINVLKRLHKSDPWSKNTVSNLKKDPAVAVKTERAVKTEPEAVSVREQATKPKIKLRSSESLMRQPPVKSEASESVSQEREKEGFNEKGRGRMRPITAAMPPQKAEPSGGVIPVGIIKRSSSAKPNATIMPHFDEESILPDDDEVHVVSTPKPSEQRTPAPQQPNIAPHTRSKKRPYSTAPSTTTTVQFAHGIGLVTSQSQSNPGAKIVKLTQVSQLPPGFTGKATPVSGPLPGAGPKPIPKPQAPAPQSNTICLDSDDEDLPLGLSIPSRLKTPSETGSGQGTLRVTASPHPVSMTAARPATSVPIPPASHENLIYTVPQSQAQMIHLTQKAPQSQGQIFTLAPQVQETIMRQLQGQSLNLNPQFRGQTITLSQQQGQPIILDQQLQGQTINLQSQLSQSNVNPHPNIVIVRASALNDISGAKSINLPKSVIDAALSHAKLSNTTTALQFQNIKPSPDPQTLNKPQVNAKVPVNPGDSPVFPIEKKKADYDAMKKDLVVTPNKAAPQPSATIGKSRTQSISSSSDSSRSPTPDADRMSIFKNVVHIQAPVDNSPKVKTNPKPSTSQSIAPKPSSSKSIPQKPNTSKSIPPKPSSSKSIPPKPSTSQTVRNSQPISSKPGPASSKMTMATRTETPNKLKATGPLRLVGSFDLTDTPATAPAAPAKPAPKSMKKISDSPSTALVGTSKDIIINSAGKPLKANDPTTAGVKPSNSRVIHITNVQTIPPKSKPAVDAKRKAEPDTSQSKKKKIEHKKPMRLEDFDIDDIDDIIELE